MDNPIGALVTFEWTDTTVQDTAYFSFGQYDEERDTDEFGVPDDRIFYYVFGGEDGLKGMMGADMQRDFRIIKYELTYPAEWDENRVDIVGSNGNDGLHYEALGDS